MRFLAAVRLQAHRPTLLLQTTQPINRLSALAHQIKQALQHQINSNLSLLAQKTSESRQVPRLSTMASVSRPTPTT
jgi:hypothetical protein